MINKDFNTRIITEVTEITFDKNEAVTSARLKTEEGLSNLKKFVLIDVSNPLENEITLYNLREGDKEKACELLEKTLFDEPSYSELDSLCDSLKSENEELKAEIEELKEIVAQLRDKRWV